MCALHVLLGAWAIQQLQLNRSWVWLPDSVGLQTRYTFYWIEVGGAPLPLPSRENSNLQVQCLHQKVIYIDVAETNNRLTLLDHVSNPKLLIPSMIKGLTLFELNYTSLLAGTPLGSLGTQVLCVSPLSMLAKIKAQLNGHLLIF